MQFLNDELQVKYLDEAAVDEGGPKREFWRLSAWEIKSKLCVGSEARLTFSHDVLGLQVSMSGIYVKDW